MNKKGQAAFTLGFALLVVAFVFVLVLFAIIDPFKEALDANRGDPALNCPGTSGFIQADFDNDTSLEKITKRSTCFVTGISMVWFVGTFLMALIVWVFKNWTRTK